MEFSHLHVHNEYSFLDGLGSAIDYSQRAKEMGFEYLALTNHGNVDGAIKFQNACKEQGIKPIHGCEFYIVPDISVPGQKGEKRKHITVFVSSLKGWHNVLKMLSIANLYGHFYKPRIDPKTILEHQEGLVFSSACTATLVSQDWGVDLFKQLDQSRVFLEIMPHQMNEQLQVNQLCYELSQKYNWPLIATNDCHYVNNGDEMVQEVLLAIQSKKRWTDPDRWKFSIKGLYLKSANEMLRAFREQKLLQSRKCSEALNNTQMLVELCGGFAIPKTEVNLPIVKGLDASKSDEELFRGLCRKGLRKKGLAMKPGYRERMNEEIGLILELGFARYFLIVWELINWCRNNDILVGPGRGSSGGSLVAYLLGITAVDPIKHGLIFARFISPARIDLPDIDMDFEDIKRSNIFQHLKDVYGDFNVAGASTFSTMKGRGALHDVARVFDVPLVDVNKASKSIVVRSGGDFRSDFTIKDAFTTFEDGKEFAKKYPQVVDYAIQLEGQVKGVGQHAAAMIISDEDLRKGERASLRKGKDGEIVVNWEREDLEYSGLMKLDVLGLSALTILNMAQKLIKENHNKDIDFEELETDDPKVFDEFTKGNCIGVFQFGSLGLRKLCQEIGVDDFNMLVHINALHRPGTLRSGMTSEFGRRKRKEVQWDFIHPFLEKITGETYGIILYQEQVMRFMYDLGGLPWKTTDTVRKVISKSKGIEQFMKFKQLFQDGCVNRKTLDFDTAGRLWDELASFGSYGFNKSHAVEYSTISYWDMWCKIYYPAEFICACLTYGGDDKKEDMIDEARRLDVPIIPPKYGISQPNKWIIKDNKLYAPFIEIKGFGEKLSEQMGKLKKSKEGFFKAGDKALSKKVQQILNEIEVFSEREDFSDQELKDFNKYFSFSFSKDKGIAFRGVLDRVAEKLTISNNKEIDFKTTEKEAKYYFGRMTEIRFGYRGKFDSLEKKMEAHGTSDNLGGVYGNFQDDTDFVMLVFDSKFYLKKKFEIEHSGGQYLLTKANRPLRTSSIQALDGWFGPELLSCELKDLNVNLLDKRRFVNKDLLNCEACHLRSECKAPVLPSRGIYNVMIIGEAPGKDEDAEGVGFVGSAGDMLWDELAQYNLRRRMFAVTNVVKCYPKTTRTPGKREINHCSKWLKEEIEHIKPIMILAFGNTSLKFFKGEDSGIMEYNAKTEWNYEYNTWISWCIHPASVLYHRENKVMFSDAIKNFKEKLKYLGMDC